MVVVLAGLGKYGTEAAARFATIPRYLDMLTAVAHSNCASKNIEVELRASSDQAASFMLQRAKTLPSLQCARRPHASRLFWPRCLFSLLLKWGLPVQSAA
jgi:hypothetical protein